MTDIEHAKKYAEESISLAISMSNPKAEVIAENACLYGLTYKNKRIADLEAQIEKMQCCQNCDFFNYRFEACYYDKECKNKDHWKLRR